MHPTSYTSHRDYSPADLARAIASARNRRDAYREGSDGYYTASAVVTTLLHEQLRRRVAGSSARVSA